MITYAVFIAQLKISQKKKKKNVSIYIGRFKQFKYDAL